MRLFSSDLSLFNSFNLCKFCSPLVGLFWFVPDFIVLDLLLRQERQRINHEILYLRLKIPQRVSFGSVTSIRPLTELTGRS